MLQELALPGGLELRGARDCDWEFLEQIFCATHWFLYPSDDIPAAGESVLHQQYLVQQAEYHSRYAGLGTFVIAHRHLPVGKILLQESASALRVIDFGFLPEHCRKGYGSAVLHALQCYGARRHLVLQLSVDRRNPLAKKLYLSLGFRLAAGSETHETLEWSAAEICGN